ncbi:unnamed protein product [Pieris brassicae]|uniref:Uncharacterized protein n=1 Tax=Pieris brassicae TaxID=7116 RepID=A0A9P0TI52_PIEBR|nr:unnamed protein product [Pieris brassicae]
MTNKLIDNNLRQVSQVLERLTLTGASRNDNEDVNSQLGSMGCGGQRWPGEPVASRICCARPPYLRPYECSGKQCLSRTARSCTSILLRTYAPRVSFVFYNKNDRESDLMYTCT